MLFQSGIMATVFVAFPFSSFFPTLSTFLQQKNCLYLTFKSKSIFKLRYLASELNVPLNS